MADDSSYTTEEIAKLLKVSKLTVYDLIKRGEIPSYRVGKQMRVDASDLEAYKQRAKGKSRMELSGHESAAVPSSVPASAIALASSNLTVPASDRTNGSSPANARSYSPSLAGPLSTQDAIAGVRPLIITGQDISLDLLGKHIEQQTTGIRPLRAYVGSLNSLIALYHGESDIVSTHLLDGDTGEYNLPYIRKLLTGFSYIVVNLLTRSAGFYVASGNPHELHSWADLKQPGIRLINRDLGTGTRVLLDEQLRLHGIRPDTIEGYETEETNHVSVAARVASGLADVGVGTERAAMLVGKVDFIPLIQERYDLVMVKKPENRDWIESVLRILRSETFRQELGSLSGYDLSLTGTVLYET